MSTEAIGVFQGDIILRTAIIEAIADVRRNPFLLDYVFRSLADDTLTNSVYGEKEIAQAKKWILKTDFPVFMNTRMDEVKLPGISIGLMNSTEAEETHADLNYVTHEDAEPDYPLVLGPFSPKSYDAITGVMTLSRTAIPSEDIAVGMVVIDDDGCEHIITEIVDDDNCGDDDVNRIFILSPNTAGEFTHAVIKNKLKSLTVTLESIQFRETYQIGVHVQSESFYLTYLHSLLVFCLAGRYKQALLEARGFERSTISSSQFIKNDALGVENGYSRFINIVGYCRLVWPKFIGTKTTSVTTAGDADLGVHFGIAGSSGPGINDKGQPQTDDDPWGVDEDALLIK